MAQLQSGAAAPAFSLPDQDGKTVSLTDFAGKKLLLYFYPKADTPGCTTQACSIRDEMPSLSASGITATAVSAVGISPDKPETLKKFRDKYDLNFPLLSDPDHKTADAYGTWGKKSKFGREYEGIIRTSFLLDEEGKVIKAWYKVSPKDTVPLAREAMAG